MENGPLHAHWQKRLYQKYVNLAGPAINLYKGKFLVRGGKVENLEGKRKKEVESEKENRCDI